jgi:IS6 family transposase
VTLYRWVQRFTPFLIDAARPCRHVAGDRWFVDETYVKVAGVRRHVYRAVDQQGQVIDVYVSQRRDNAAARRSLAERESRERHRQPSSSTNSTAIRPGAGAWPSHHTLPNSSKRTTEA